MDTHKNAPLTPKGRETMVRAVVDCGLSKAAAIREMTTPTAILISGLILAVTGLFLFRWDMRAANEAAVQESIDDYAVYRLDRWTGSVNRCATSVSIPGRLPCE
jgi:hypothetical protein